MSKKKLKKKLKKLQKQMAKDVRELEAAKLVPDEAFVDDEAELKPDEPAAEPEAETEPEPETKSEPEAEGDSGAEAEPKSETTEPETEAEKRQWSAICSGLKVFGVCVVGLMIAVITWNLLDSDSVASKGLGRYVSTGGSSSDAEIAELDEYDLLNEITFFNFRRYLNDNSGWGWLRFFNNYTYGSAYSDYPEHVSWTFYTDRYHVTIITFIIDKDFDGWNPLAAPVGLSSRVRVFDDDNGLTFYTEFEQFEMTDAVISNDGKTFFCGRETFKTLVSLVEQERLSGKYLNPFNDMRVNYTVEKTFATDIKHEKEWYDNLSFMGKHRYDESGEEEVSDDNDEE